MKSNSAQIKRADGRMYDEMRPVVIRRGFTKYAEGAVFIEIGDTQVICNASIIDSVPGFLEGSGKGWVTAEYSMLPRATDMRGGRGPSGRGHEIQRLIGRSLRSVIDLAALGPRTLIVDCDVIQADGGTRTASITGGFVALHDACSRLIDSNQIASMPIRDYIAATSVGLVDGVPMLDLCHGEDSRAQVDLNMVVTRSETIVEIQGTAEKTPFERAMLDELLDLAQAGIKRLIDAQIEVLGEREGKA